jgi:hypothetical protein
MDARALPRRLPVVLALVAAALAAALAPSPARAAADCTPSSGWKVSVQLGHANAISSRLASERVASGRPRLDVAPTLTKMAMFRALQLAGAGHDPIDTSALAEACGVARGWAINWQWSGEGGTKSFLDRWLGSALSARLADGRWTSVGVGAAKGANGLIYMAVVFSNNPADAGSRTWPISGWPAFPSSTAAPGSGGESNQPSDAPSGTRVCFPASGCADVHVHATTRFGRFGESEIPLEPGVDDRSITVCSGATSPEGESLKVSPLFAGSSLAVHVGAWSASLKPAWKLRSDGLERCATVAVPHAAPRFGAHKIWFTLHLNGTTVPSAKTGYGADVGILVGKARSHWLNSSKLSVRLPVQSKLFRYATPSRPITLVCEQRRGTGKRTVAATVKLTRATTKPVLCPFVLPAGRSTWTLSATVRRTPKLTSFLAGAKVRRGGLTFWMP